MDSNSLFSWRGEYPRFEFNKWVLRVPLFIVLSFLYRSISVSYPHHLFNRYAATENIRSPQTQIGLEFITR